MDSQTQQHRMQASARLSSLGKKFFEFIEFDENEELILEIRKHNFGLFLVQLTGLFVTLIIVLATLFLASGLSSTLDVDLGSSGGKSVIIAAGLILGVLSIIGTEISVMLYRSNVIFVTSEKIAQVLYISLFNRKLSQLSIGDVQDVTVKQAGIFPRIFNYGTLIVETAGEQQNYTFTYVPKPYAVSMSIVGAHEENLKLYGN